MKINEIKSTLTSSKKNKRRGRGAGSGLGKTAGRGVKGQKSRSGVSINGFEGGQMPLYRRLPKRGFNNIFRKKYREINLGRVQAAIDSGKIDPVKVVDIIAMKSAGLIKTSRDGVRLLGKGNLTSKISIEVAGASQAAIQAVERLGGAVIIATAAKFKIQNNSSVK